jgi:malonyl-CoA/methylmalonyl-CoA synthetase
MSEVDAPDATSVRAWALHAGTDVRPDELRASLAAGSLPEAFHQTAQRDPLRRALSIGGETATHGDLDRRAAVAAAWLRDRGLRAADRLVISSPNSLAMVVAYLATLRLGAIAVLVSPTLTVPELRRIMETSGARAALAGGPALDRLRELTGDGAALRWVASLTDELIEALATGKDASGVDVSPVHSDDIAILAFTSGTTGRPKGVPLSHSNLLASIRAAMMAWRWTEDDVLVHALPLTHQHGLSGLHATLVAGSRLALMDRFDADQLTATVSEQSGTVLFAVPTMYQRLLDGSGHTGALAGLRLAISGSAPLSSELAARIGQELGQVPLQRYGTTESGLDVSNPVSGARIPGTVGLPLPGVELRVADGDGRARSEGAEGEVLLRGPQVFSGYLNDDAATAAAFHADGWFRTGDIGRLDPATGYLHITGRLKELIISGGLNVFPQEVEAALEASPDVAEAGVAGVPSEHWGEEVTAWVVPVRGRAVEVDTLAAYLRTTLAAYKCPKRIHVVEQLPRNSVGKLLRRELVAPPGTRSTNDDPTNN